MHGRENIETLNQKHGNIEEEFAEWSCRTLKTRNVSWSQISVNSERRSLGFLLPWGSLLLCCLPARTRVSETVCLATGKGAIFMAPLCVCVKVLLHGKHGYTIVGADKRVRHFILLLFSTAESSLLRYQDERSTDKQNITEILWRRNNVEREGMKGEHRGRERGREWEDREKFELTFSVGSWQANMLRVH